MMLTIRQCRDSRTFLRFIPLAFLLVFLLTPAAVRAQKSEEFDAYKMRLDAFWFYSSPSGSIRGNAGTDIPIDFHRDLGFETYPTFYGTVDWKFTHKNHFYITISPFWTSRQTTLNRQIVFKGQVFDVGLVTQSNLHAFLVAPGYQYDIIRRKRGHLGIGVQFNLFDTTAKISAAAQVTSDGVHHAAVSASGSLLAPIPVAGPQFRLYLTSSPRVFVEGNVYGMYFFGYGDFVSTADSLGVTLTKHISANFGYQLASRLNITGTSNRIALNLTQKAPSSEWNSPFSWARPLSGLRPRSSKESICNV
jgi:hypothetical protein